MTEKEFSFKYGQSYQKIFIKNEVEILTRNEKNGIELKNILKSLDNPVYSPPLKDIITGKGDVIIIVSDITRKTGVHIYLPSLIERLEKCGTKEDDISIIFAGGTHRVLNKTEKKQIVGEKIFNRIRLLNHDAFASDSLVSYGYTKKGTPIMINKHVAKVKHIILTGSVVFHYLAGFGGGRKSIAPGISGFDTVVSTHLMALSKEIGKGRANNIRSGVLKNNPIHNEMIEIMNKVKPCFLINTVLNSKHEIIKLVAGNPHKAHLNLCHFFKENYSLLVNKLYDVVIAGCGGYPKDINFIQAHKTIDNAFYAVKEGGTLIILGECTQGVSSDEFLSWLKFGDLAEMEAELHKNFAIYGQTAWATLCKSCKINIIFVSTLPEKIVKSMKMIPASTLEHALDIALKKYNKNCSIAMIPEGSLFLPVFTPQKI